MAIPESWVFWTSLSHPRLIENLRGASDIISPPIHDCDFHSGPYNSCQNPVICRRAKCPQDVQGRRLEQSDNGAGTKATQMTGEDKRREEKQGVDFILDGLQWWP